MMRFLSNIALLILAFINLSACNPRINVGGDIGKVYRLEKVLVKGGDFVITTYQKITDVNAPYVFYIEGDGDAFEGRYVISRDPTPKKQMLIKLMVMDERPNVVYVARPCQYTPMQLNPKCTNHYWTDKRFSDDSVQAINEVINKINSNNKQFSLVGYSGGGGIAVLVAARNPKVKDITTLAGNLDILSFTQYHNVRPMIGSLNPIDYAAKVRNIPQNHISGGMDTVVLPFIAHRFVEAAASRCVKQTTYDNVTHTKGWSTLWKQIYNLPVTCYND